MVSSDYDRRRRRRCRRCRRIHDDRRRRRRQPGALRAGGRALIDGHVWGGLLGAVLSLSALGHALVAVGLLLIYQHTLVKPDDLSRLNAAFFTTNAFVSVILLLTFGGAVFMAKL